MRTGHAPIRDTVPWKRRVGGQYGTVVQLPAGCYSDDTQLRLATSRSIRGNGQFDVRTFTKIELPVWLAYALGGGLSTKAAAEHLTRPRVHWFNNYYHSGRVDYLEAGGNGGAMRIQPHVWCAADPLSPRTFLPDVLRNIVATHGHPRALVGAAFHAICLAYALAHARVPSPEEWETICDVLSGLQEWINSDSELGQNWLPEWERLVGGFDGLAVAVTECRRELSLAAGILKANEKTPYEEMVIATRANSPSERGSGIKTSVLSLMLAWMYRTNPAGAVIEAANVLRTDTDSIASMAGAVLGMVADSDPPGMIQDAEYIAAEAVRLATIAQGEQAESFPYPDPHAWQVPTSLLDVVGDIGPGHLGLAGLGSADPIAEPWSDVSRKELAWQWLRLNFGQSVLARRRVAPKQMNTKALPQPEPGALPRSPTSPEAQQPLFSEPSSTVARPSPKEVNSESIGRPLGDEAANWALAKPTVEEAFDTIVSSRFDRSLIGRYLLELSLRKDGHALAIAFAAMVSKAWRSRRLPPPERP